MVLKNANTLDKIFISESIFQDGFATVDQQEGTTSSNEKSNVTEITLANPSIVKLDDSIYLLNIKKIAYIHQFDIIIIENDLGAILNKVIKTDKIIHIQFIEEDEDTLLEIKTVDLPMFLFQSIDNDKYPKVEIKLSDCVYEVKIFTDNDNYVLIPFFQSHFTIKDTMKYLSELVELVTEQRPELITDLIDSSKIEITINTEQGDVTEEYEYTTSTAGISLINEAFESGCYTIDWHKFFKIIIDGTWKIKLFTENTVERDCNTCANYTEPDEVDNGCYMLQRFRK